MVICGCVSLLEAEAQTSYIMKARQYLQHAECNTLHDTSDTWTGPLAGVDTTNMSAFGEIIQVGL
jgi:hypothetical protein